jgi:hypothetical protein
LLDSTRRRWWNTAREHDSPTARCLICYHHPARLRFNRLSAIGKPYADYRTRDRRNAQGCWRVDIWTFGAPPRKYRVLGVINDTRGGGVIPMAGYYSGIAAKVKQYGGNAAIEMSSRSQYVGTASFANATTTTSGGFTGTGYRYGNVVDVAGNVNTTSNTFASGTSVPLFKHHGQFLVT